MYAFTALMILIVVQKVFDLHRAASAMSVSKIVWGPLRNASEVRDSLRDLPYCTAAVSGNGLSIVTSADGSFSRPGK